MKKLILSPKDTTSKMILTNVESFYQEGRTLVIVFTDGRIRNYPLEHLWYYESGDKKKSDV
jgi:hypothetical protein